MPTAIKHSIDAYTGGDFIDEVKIGGSIEVSERRGTNGVIAKTKAFNPTNEFSLKGGGSSGLTLGVSAATIGGLSGGVKNLTKDDYTQVNNDFDSFDASGKHYPNASAQA
jgi:hypothetical protein